MRLAIRIDYVILNTYFKDNCLSPAWSRRLASMRIREVNPQPVGSSGWSQRLTARVVGVGLGLGLLLHSAPFATGQPRTPATGQGTQAVVETLPVSAVREGMTGYGLTVFQGEQPARFAVRVVGVLRKYLTGMDLILIHCDDERLKHSGVAAGMSGSPIYLEGKLAGALSYGWSFAKDPLAGVTPIEYMLKDLREPIRGTPGSEGAGQPERAMGATGLGEGRPVRLGVPLSVAGLPGRALDELGQSLRPLGMQVLQGSSGGGSSSARGATQVVPGGVVAVQLVRGDVSIAATGTVTYVEGQRLVAFGHPLMGLGDAQLPLATGEIVTFMSSLASSFKLASPGLEVGMMTRDRQAGIVGELGQKAPMIPVWVELTTATGTNQQVLSRKRYQIEVASHPMLSPLFLASAVNGMLQASAPDLTDATLHIQTSLSIAGHAPLVGSDVVYSAEGLTQKQVNLSTGMKQLGELLRNPFGPVTIEKMSLTAQVAYKNETIEILGASLGSDEIDANESPTLAVTLRPYGQSAYVRNIPLTLPKGLGGQTLKVEVAAGPQVKPELAPPERLSDLIENLRKGHNGQTLVVTLQTADEGMLVRGRVVPNLPGSVLATLRPSGTAKRGEPFKKVFRTTVQVNGVLSGKQELTVLVRDEVR